MKSEFKDKIAQSKKQDAARREALFWLNQAKECYSYIEVGEDYGLREQCLHAVRIAREKISEVKQQFKLNIYTPVYWII